MRNKERDRIANSKKLRVYPRHKATVNIAIAPAMTESQRLDFETFYRVMGFKK